MNWFSVPVFAKLSVWMNQTRVSSTEWAKFSSRPNPYPYSLEKDCPIVVHRALHLCLHFVCGRHNQTFIESPVRDWIFKQITWNWRTKIVYSFDPTCSANPFLSVWPIDQSICDATKAISDRRPAGKCVYWICQNFRDLLATTLVNCTAVYGTPIDLHAANSDRIRTPWDDCECCRNKNEQLWRKTKIECCGHTYW